MVKQAAVKSIDSAMSVHRPPSKSIHWKVFVRIEFSLVAHTHTHAACTHATYHSLIYFTRHNRVSIRVRFRQAIFVSFLLYFLNFIAIVLNLWKMCNAKLYLSSNFFFYFLCVSISSSSSAFPFAGLISFHSVFNYFILSLVANSKTVSFENSQHPAILLIFIQIKI